MKIKKFVIPIISAVCVIAVVFAAWAFGLFDLIKASTRKIDADIYREVYNRYTYNANADTDYFPLFPRPEGEAYTGFVRKGTKTWSASLSCVGVTVQEVKEHTRDFKKVDLADNAYILTEGENKILLSGDEYENGVWVNGYIVVNDVPFIFSVMCDTDRKDQEPAFDYVCQMLSEITTE